MPALITPSLLLHKESPCLFPQGGEGQRPKDLKLFKDLTI